jgi:hypothetical protein
MGTILPSAINSNWFYLDDPTSVVMGTKISQDLSYFIPGSLLGRYIPIYWYYRGLIFRVFGNTPTASYVIQALCVLATMLLIYWIVKVLTRSRIAGLFASLIFLTGNGVAENAYTLGKQEPLVLLSLLIVIAASIALYLNKSSKTKRILYFVAIVIFTLSAIWNKEPSMLVVVLAVCFLLASKIWKAKNNMPAVAIIVGLIASRLPQVIFRPSNINSTYTSFGLSLTTIKLNTITYLQQDPDVAILFALSSIMVLLLLVKTLRKPVKDDNARLNKIVVLALFLIVSVYVGVLIIWRWALSYYLYVPLGLLAIIFTVVLYRLRFVEGIITKNMFILLIAIIAATRLVSIPYNIYVGHAQYVLNSMYTSAIEEYQNQASTDNRLVVENWDFYGEEAYQTNLLVQNINSRPELKVEGIGDLIQNRKISEETLKLYDWKETLDPVARWPKQGDFVLVITSNLTTYWSVRDVMPIVKLDSVLPEKGYQLELVSEKQAIYNLPFIELTAAGYKYRIRESQQGYKLYKVIKAPANLNELYRPI